ncbi:hypothetical protein CFP56_017137 [Quercus suber]|uniref:Uncharacterized protein n=1 Tax=Quercus suber TaxID=58331 RepID=A0AAW0M1Z2_QUESU
MSVIGEAALSAFFEVLFDKCILMLGQIEINPFPAITNYVYSILTCNADLDSEEPNLRIGRFFVSATRASQGMISLLRKQWLFGNKLDTSNGSLSHRCNARGRRGRRLITLSTIKHG